MKKTVYLAGPITDRTHGQANGWRIIATDALSEHCITGISPLRCEPLAGERYTLSSSDPRFGTPRAIASKNFMDVQMCDLTLCYMPKEINERRLSLGTLMELAWAHALRKPTILVTDDPLLIDHPVVQANASWIVPALGDAIDIIVGLFFDYTK